MTYDECIDDSIDIIGRIRFPNIAIQIDGGFSFSTPHINIYNDLSGHWNATKVATLSLLTDEIFYRGEDWIDQWLLTKREIWTIRQILRWGHPCECRYTYWQMACRHWNEIKQQNDEIKLPMNWKYHYRFDKKFDEMNKDKSNYIPSTQPIPHWHY